MSNKRFKTLPHHTVKCLWAGSYLRPDYFNRRSLSSCGDADDDIISNLLCELQNRNFRTVCM